MEKGKEYYEKIYDSNTWLDIHVKHLSYIRNLLLVLAAASLGYTLNILRATSYEMCCCLIFIIKLSCFLFLLSITVGVIIALLESKNYRLKWKISRLIQQKKDFSENDTDFISLQQKCSYLESTNTNLLYIQSAFFLISIILMTLIFLIN